jgi:hypothetical protein
MKQYDIRETTEFFIRTTVQSMNAALGLSLDWNNFAIQHVVDSVSHLGVGKVSGERRCIFDIYSTEERVRYRVWFRPDRATYFDQPKLDLINNEGHDPLERMYNIDARVERAFFPFNGSSLKEGCPDVREGFAADIPVLLYDYGLPLLTENELVLFL